MEPQSVLSIVEDIWQDLPSVKWSHSKDEPAPEGADAYRGTGARWSHNLIVWKDSSGDRCDGAVVSMVEAKGLIVRYTPALAKQALQLVKDGGLRG